MTERRLAIALGRLVLYGLAAFKQALAGYVCF